MFVVIGQFEVLGLWLWEKPGRVLMKEEPVAVKERHGSFLGQRADAGTRGVAHDGDPARRGLISSALCATSCPKT
jgi:hypothetical protein